MSAFLNGFVFLWFPSRSLYAYWYEYITTLPFPRLPALDLFCLLYSLSPSHFFFSLHWGRWGWIGVLLALLRSTERIRLEHVPRFCRSLHFFFFLVYPYTLSAHGLLLYGLGLLESSRLSFAEFKFSREAIMERSLLLSTHEYFALAYGQGTSEILIAVLKSESEQLAGMFTHGPKLTCLPVPVRNRGWPWTCLFHSAT